METRTLVVSADEHVVEPPEFWNEFLPSTLSAAERERAPRLKGLGIAVDGPKSEIGRAFRLFPDLVTYSDDAPGAGEVRGRVAVLDREGIDVAVVFPQRAMSMWAIADRALMTKCFDAYNQWLAQLCAESGGRLVGVPILPTVYAPEQTGAYLDRLVGLGFRTVMLPNYPKGVSYADPAMEPMWSAIEASGLPLNFHISESPDDNGPGGLGTYLAVSFQPFRKLWAYLVFSGILERHPRLPVVFAEGGISWVPSALDHADRIHRDFAAHLDPQLPRRPSEYWHRQCYATFMEDQRGVEQLDFIGSDRVLWSSDYPHPEGTFGRTTDVLAAVRAVAGDRFADIIGGNAALLYGL